MPKKEIEFTCRPVSVNFQLLVAGSKKVPGADGKVKFSVEPGTPGLTYVAIGQPATSFTIALTDGGEMDPPVDRAIPADGDTGGFRRCTVKP